MDYSQSKQTTKQWHHCQEEAEERVSSQYATKLTCSNNRANRGYRPNHDVAPCWIGSLTTANTVNNGWENEPAAIHRGETHVSLKENRNRTPKTENNQLPHLPKPVPLLQSDVFLGQRAGEGSSFPVREQPLARLQGINLASCKHLLAPKHSWSGSHSERAKRFHAFPSSRGQMSWRATWLR